MANKTAASALSGANSTAYRLYSSHLLTLFSSSWVASWTSSSTATLNFSALASFSAHAADDAYLQTYAGPSRTFGHEVLKSITMGDFLADTPARASFRLEEFAVGYVANTTSLTDRFVEAAFSLGRTYDNSSLSSLAGGLVWDPSRLGADPSSPNQFQPRTTWRPPLAAGSSSPPMWS